MRRASAGGNLIQRCEFVRIQIVHHHDDRVCLREMDIDQVAHAVGKIDHGAAHLDMSQACSGAKQRKRLLVP